ILAIGIGSRAVSSAHQHGPAGLQVNSVPQPEQARRRETGTSNRFVINRIESGLCFSCRFHVERRYHPQENIRQERSRKSEKGDWMARDSQAALVALNRFGF